jgi:hypothetical protein
VQLSIFETLCITFSSFTWTCHRCVTQSSSHIHHVRFHRAHCVVMPQARCYVLSVTQKKSFDLGSLDEHFVENT